MKKSNISTVALLAFLFLAALPAGAQTLTVTSPNGGESWQVGDIQDITWTSEGSFTNVSIDYSINNGGDWINIVQPTANDGSYPWHVPNNPSTNCLVRVRDAANLTTSDVSNAVFTIAASGGDTVAVTAPNGGENWEGGEAHDITWTSTGSIANVNIDYSTDSGNSWTPVAAGTANDGSHHWTVPNTPSETCLVRVSDADGSPSDRSNAVFIIAAARTVTVTSPNGGENWEVGETREITWIASGSIANVNIDYSTDSGGSWNPIVASTSNDGSYAWSVPNDLATTCRVRVSDAADAGVTDQSNANFTIAAASTLTVTAPNGGENWKVGEEHDITWTASGSIANVNIDYSTNSGGSWTPVVAGTANDGSYHWTVPDTPSTNCLVLVRDTDGSPFDISAAIFTIAAVETVSAPTSPAGPGTGVVSTSYAYSTGGSTSTLGHSVQYKFDWNDGSDSGWLAVGTTQASHNWAAAGTYNVKAMARCADHTSIESPWSATLTVIISDPSSSHYNSPAQYNVLPEVIWASATGGGIWMSSAQVTDVTGGSIVSVYYNTGTTRRGPLQLWDNSGGAALSSAKYDNLLDYCAQLDGGAFNYYGTVGAVEFITQDANHKIHAAARTLNGFYAKTFTALSLHDANTADTSRAMVVANLTNNVNYRSTAGFFNPTSDSVTVEFTLLDASNSQVGTPFSRTLAGHEFQAFNPFIQAGVSYPANSFDNVILRVRPTSGTGKIVCFGATVDNVTNDPAAHVAVQGASGYDNSPGSHQILPEAIWATATGGGTWVSEVQIVDATGGSVVTVYFDYGGGNWRGPFTLWTGGTAGTKVKYTNLLETIDSLDSEAFAYYGKVGTVEFQTQDGSHAIQVTARTLNGNYSKTFPGLNLVNAETADATRTMLIQNYTNNVGYRSTSGFFNPSEYSVTVEFTLLDSSGAQIGSQFSKTLAGYDFQAFNPFIQAGVPYPANSYDNIILRIRPTSGAGEVMCFGASVDNASNDPASHLAVQGE